MVIHEKITDIIGILHGKFVIHALGLNPVAQNAVLKYSLGMKVIDVNWGSWFKLKDDKNIYFFILCQIGRGTNRLYIEWNDRFQNEMDIKSLTQEQLLEHILNTYYDYSKEQVARSVRKNIDDVIERYHETSKDNDGETS